MEVSIRKTRICDRCGEEIKYYGWTALIFHRPKSTYIKMRKLLNGNQSGYEYSDWDFELCNKCTRAFHKFMDGDGNG